MDEYLQESSFENDFNENEVCLEKCNSLITSNSSRGGFECNICLDLVRDPVVTLCGHLYCWRCIYLWINSQTENYPDHHKPNCPVCKTEVSQKTLIPLYGRGQSTSDKHSDFVPQRPSSPRCCDNVLLENRTTNHLPPHGPNYGQPYYSSRLTDPMIGMLGEMVYSRIFGNTDTSLYTYPNSYHLVGSDSLRVRRADRSLSRVCFFLCCCVMACLVLF